MPTFAFKATVYGLDLNDATQLDALYSDDLVLVPAEVDGVTAIYVEVDESNGERAYKVFSDHLATACPDVRVLRVDDDLVNVPTIAERLEVTRQAVAMWVAGTRSDGTFPLHRAVVGGQRVWTWACVYAWADVNGRLPGDTPAPLDDACVAWINGQLVPSTRTDPSRPVVLYLGDNSLRWLFLEPSWVKRAQYTVEAAVEPVPNFASRSGETWVHRSGTLHLASEGSSRDA